MAGDGDGDPHDASFVTQRKKKKNPWQEDPRLKHAKKEQSKDKRETFGRQHYAKFFDSGDDLWENSKMDALQIIKRYQEQ